jgi:hypothetical protein
MANSGGISKRPILPVAKGGPASTCGTSCRTRCDVAWQRARWHRNPSDPEHLPWRDCTWLCIGGGQAHVGVLLDTSRWALRRGMSRSDTNSAPAVSSPGGSNKHIAKFAQFGCPGSFVERGGDVFCRTSHLVNAVRQVSGLVGGQHHRVGGECRHFAPVQCGSLLVCPLPTGPPTVLAATTHPDIGYVSTAPAAGLRADTTGHVADFSRPRSAIPVSLRAAPHRPRVGPGTTPSAVTFAMQRKLHYSPQRT